MIKKIKKWISNILLTASFKLQPPSEERLISGVGAISNAKRTFLWMQTQEHWKNLSEFAATFGHKITTRRYPTCMFLKNGKPYGYAYISRDPVAFTAWHSDRNVCTSRDVHETFQMLTGWGKFEHGGGFVTAPIDSKTFTPEVMIKLGFGDTNCHLWEIRNN